MFDEEEWKKTKRNNDEYYYSKLVKGEKLLENEIKYLFITDSNNGFDVIVPTSLSIAKQLLFLFLYYRRFKLLEGSLDVFVEIYNEYPVTESDIKERILKTRKIYDAINTVDYFSIEDLIDKFIKDVSNQKEWEDWINWFTASNFREYFSDELRETVDQVFNIEQFKHNVSQSIEQNGVESTKKILAKAYPIILKNGLKEMDMIYLLVEETKKQLPELSTNKIFEKIGDEIDKDAEAVKTQYYRGETNRKKIKSKMKQEGFDF